MDPYITNLYDEISQRKHKYMVSVCNDFMAQQQFNFDENMCPLWHECSDEQLLRINALEEDLVEHYYQIEEHALQDSLWFQLLDADISLPKRSSKLPKRHLYSARKFGHTK